MKYEELAFLNQQLAGMLRQGIPLEKGLRELCRTLDRGDLKTELEALTDDLARGNPLAEAVEKRKLPLLYRQMVKVGAESGDLPALLTLVADHYRRDSQLKLRLKGLMVYPIIVLTAIFVVSTFLAWTLSFMMPWEPADYQGITDYLTSQEASAFPSVYLHLWAVPVMMIVLAASFIVCLIVPPIRNRLSWVAPGFREANLARLANSIWLLLRGGCSLDRVLAFLHAAESPSPVRRELDRWQKRLAAGEVRFAASSGKSKAFPRLFIWLVESSGEDMAQGFCRAGELYANRAQYRSDVLLQAALPTAVVALGVLIAGQFFPVFRAVSHLISALGM